MNIICFGESIRSSASVLLCSNVVANIYNLILISFNCSRLEFVRLLGNDVAYNWYLILIQTILMIIGMLCINKKSAVGTKILLKYWLFGFIAVILFLEFLAVISFAILIYGRQAVDKFWRMKGDNMTQEAAPFYFHLFVATLFICYLAFKLYTSVIIFFFGNDFANHALSDFNTENQQVVPRNDEHIIVPLPVTPLNDRPPRYSEVFKD